MADVSFDKSFWTFHLQLKRHNERAWFQANKERYEAEVKQPLIVFVDALVPKMAAISRHIAPGSIFRVYRDTRFSPDKSPYKTHSGIQFRHAAASGDVHGPGFYLHLEPGASFAAAGMWRPDNISLAAIRKAIATDPKAWHKARGKQVLGGDALKKVPRGFDPEHPAADDLRRKDFICSQSLSDAQVTASGFMQLYLKACKDAAPFLRYLATAVGLPF